MICDLTTWVPNFSWIAAHCHALRLAYHHYGLAGAAGNGLGGRNCATIFYRRTAHGNLCHVTCSSEAGPAFARHSERVCHDELLAREVWTAAQAAARIICVYTEREPCGADLHNCRAFLQGWLAANTPVFWSFAYPAVGDKRVSDDSDDDDSGSGDDHDGPSAKRARGAGTKDLKGRVREIDYDASTFQPASYTSGGGGVTVNAGPISDEKTMAMLDHVAQSGELPAQTPLAVA